MTFEVPPNVPFRSLQLELPARVPLEQEVSGVASFARPEHRQSLTVTLRQLR